MTQGWKAWPSSSGRDCRRIAIGILRGDAMPMTALRATICRLRDLLRSDDPQRRQRPYPISHRLRAPTHPPASLYGRVPVLQYDQRASGRTPGTGDAVGHKPEQQCLCPQEKSGQRPAPGQSALGSQHSSTHRVGTHDVSPDVLDGSLPCVRSCRHGAAVPARPGADGWLRACGSISVRAQNLLLNK